MTQLTPEQWLSKNSSKAESTTTRATSKKVQSPEEWLKDPQINPPKPSTLGKVAGFLAPTITKTVGKYQRGEDITARDIVGSGLEAASYVIPVGAVAKGASLLFKAGTLASKLAIPAAVGAVSGASFGAGQAVAGGEGAGGIAKEALTQGAIGSVIGGAFGAAGAGLAARKLAKSKLAEDTLAKVESSVIPEPTPQEFVAQAKEKATVPTQELPNTKKVNLTDGLQNKSDLIKNKEPIQPTVPITPQESVAIAKAKKEGVPYVKPELPKEPIFSQEQRQQYEKVLEEDPVFVSGATTNKDIVDNFENVVRTQSKDDIIDAIYGVNGKKLPDNLPESAAYNLIRQDASLTAKQVERLINKQPLSKAGFDLQAAKVKSGAIMDNPIDIITKTERDMQEIASTKGITIKSIKDFLTTLICPI